MEPSRPLTWYATLSRREARLVLVLVVALLSCGLAAALTQPTLPPEGSEEAGVAFTLYRNIVNDVHAGKSYYDAAGYWLPELKFPCDRLLNWRPPSYAWLLGSFPDPRWGQVLLIIIAGVTILLA